MQRMMLTLALVVVLGAGMLVGSLLPTVQAAPKPAQYTVPVLPEARLAVPPGTSPYVTGVYGRWQIVILATPDRARTLTILLDSATGASYLLTPMTGRTGYVWESINRGL